MFKMPSDAEIARASADLSAVTAEDLEFDRKLDEMAKEMPDVSDKDTGVVLELRKIKEDLEHLKSCVEKYLPASTMSELNEQVHIAKQEGCNSVDATPTLVKSIFRSSFDHIEKETGYGIYHDVRVYIDGYFDKNKNVDKLTIDQKNERKPEK